jgi:CRP/FNR family transcriptional regulator, anaerobic regulatory protein
VLRHEGAPDPLPHLLLDGWTSSSVTFPSGGRQMLRINIPGDMLGSPSLALIHA